MEYKIFRGEKLYFKDLKPYFGPVTLMYRPNMTIFTMMGKYLIEMDGMYYEINEVEFEGTTYSFKDFQKKFLDVYDF